jgi:hypothetical protein
MADGRWQMAGGSGLGAQLLTQFSVGSLRRSFAVRRVLLRIASWFAAVLAEPLRAMLGVLRFAVVVMGDCNYNGITPRKNGGYCTTSQLKFLGGHI